MADDQNDHPDRTPRGRPESRRPTGERSFRKPHRDDERAPRKRVQRPEEERPRRPPREAAPAAEAPEPAEERIAKVMARAGVASRRDAEAMIAEGRVALNGEVLTSPAVNVTRDDRITVDGEPLPARERTRLWIFHKPRGLVTTARDPQGRPTVFESLPEDMPRVVAIGRLDINTEGLLLLTNDGGLARVIAHPETGWLRRYKVRAHGEITQERLDDLRGGITIEGVDYGPVEARLDRIQGDNAWITIGLREGKNREIKNILEHLGLSVNRLIRLSFGPFQLGDLEPGLVEEVRTKVLREQLGDTLAKEAGVDFESPVRDPIAPFGSPNKDAPAGGERPQRGERFDRDRDPRGERGERPFRSRDERPARGGRDERPARGREERPARGGRDDPAPRPARDERRPSVWRADDAEGARAKGPKVPRRGADPKEARAAAGARQHERVGVVQSGEGRKVLVERLVSEPKPEDERPARRSRGDAPPRGDARPRARAPGGDDRPRRREGPGGDRDRSFGERPPHGGEDRPFRKPRESAGPKRDRDERPRGGGFRADGPRERPSRGGSRDEGPRRGAGGGGFGKGPRSPRPGGTGPRAGAPKGTGPRGSGPGRGGPRPGGSGPPRGAGPRGSGPKGPPRGRRS
jgi:23S rRNA pseudouridine2605 synthase